MAAADMPQVSKIPHRDIGRFVTTQGNYQGPNIARSEEEDLTHAIVKRSVIVSGHKTSVSLEEPFWQYLKEIAGKSDRHLSNVVADIKANRGPNNLSSAIRLFVFETARAQAGSAKV